MVPFNRLTVRNCKEARRDASFNFAFGYFCAMPFNYLKPNLSIFRRYKPNHLFAKNLSHTTKEIINLACK